MLLNCKFCGGELEIAEGASITTCKYCRTTQTLPVTKDEGTHNLFNRANNLRRRNEFDKAEAAFEKIIEADGTEPEAYWGLVLCKYGIEYVEDPATGKRIPTCHRASFDSVIADGDFKSAIEYADAERRALYEEQAKEIDRIQRDILALAQNEEPYDVFICYKETDDETGKKTRDSFLANELYYQYTQEGFKVFYAAITLEGKLGEDYESIIFAALNSAKVMLVVGSKPEYFNAVWVKNEWSRFLKIMKKDRKKLLIPCYRDMDAYELPDEFAHLQAQDMNKFGSAITILNGINRVMEAFKAKPEVIVNNTETIIKDTVIKEPVIKETTIIKESAPSQTPTSNVINISALLRRAFMFLEDGEFKKADSFCEQVLNQEPENAEAYLGKLMAELGVRKKEKLKDCAQPFGTNNNCQKVIRFGDEALKTEIKGYIEHIKERNEADRLGGIYKQAETALRYAKTESEYKKAAELFKSILEYKNASALANDALVKAETERRKREEEKQKAEEEQRIAAEKAEEERKEGIYRRAISALGTENITSLKNAITSFASISTYKDSYERIQDCRNKISKIQIDEENARKEREELEAKRAAAEKRRLEEARAEQIRIEQERLEQERIEQEQLAADNKRRERKTRILSWCIILALVLIPVGCFVCSSIFNNINDYRPSTGNTKPSGTGSGTESGSGGGNKTPLSMFEYEITTNGYTITGVKDKTITSVTIPSSVTKIGDNAFNDCNMLKSITVESGNTVYKSIDGNLYTKDGKTLIKYAIGKTATSLTIPNTVDAIAEDAFIYCYYLTSVTIPDSVTSIGRTAFWNCNRLTSVTISDSVTSIGENAFAACHKLTSINVSSENSKYKDIDGNLYTKDGKTLIQYAIGKTAKSFTIPNTVETIDNHAFGSCDSLTSVTIPDSVISIVSDAFSYCHGLTSVTISDSVKKIDNRAFQSCTSLTGITVSEENTVYKSIDGNLYTKDGKALIQYAIGKNDTSFTIPDSVETIGSYAFEDCDSLTSVTIGNSVGTIGSYAFDGCKSLAKINYCGPEAKWKIISNEKQWGYYSNGTYYKINYTITYNYTGA